MFFHCFCASFVPGTYCLVYLLYCVLQSNVILYFIIIVMLIFTMKRLKNETLQRSNTDDKDLILHVMFKSLAQFIILGCYWILLYIPNESGVLYNTFLFLNSQQGTVIFLVHCLLNQEVSDQLKETHLFIYSSTIWGGKSGSATGFIKNVISKRVSNVSVMHFI